MSKHVILLGSKLPGEKNNITEMASIFTHNADVVTQTVYWEDLVFDIARDTQSVEDVVSKTDLAGADLVIALNWYRGGKQSMYKEAAFSLALYLQSRQVAFWNEEMAQQRSSSKLSAIMQLALLGIDVPRTQFALDARVLLAASTVQYPLILKAANASRGRANYKIDTKAELLDKLKTVEAPNRFLIQEYIANESDLRVICVDYEPRLVIERRRQQSDQHLNNTSQGATATLIDLNSIKPAILQSCREICHDMGRNIAGIDLMYASDDSNRTVFLEVNAIPQLTSGVFVAEKLAVIELSVAAALERKQV